MPARGRETPKKRSWFNLALEEFELIRLVGLDIALFGRIEIARFNQLGKGGAFVELRRLLTSAGDAPRDTLVGGPLDIRKLR